MVLFYHTLLLPLSSKNISWKTAQGVLLADKQNIPYILVLITLK